LQTLRNNWQTRRYIAFSKESVEKDTQITKSSRAFDKGSCNKDYKSEINHNKESKDEHILGKDSPLGSMSVEKVQSSIADAVNAQLS